MNVVWLESSRVTRWFYGSIRHGAQNEQLSGVLFYNVFFNPKLITTEQHHIKVILCMIKFVKQRNASVKVASDLHLDQAPDMGFELGDEIRNAIISGCCQNRCYFCPYF